MKNLSLIALMSLVVPVVAGAQVPTPPTPPVPPAPPAAPMAAPAPLAAPARVMIPDLVEPSLLDVQMMKERARAEAQAAQVHSSERYREMAESARRQAESVRMNSNDVKRLAEMARADASALHPVVVDHDFVYAFDQSAATSFGQTFAGSDTERSYYDRGQSALQQRQYEQAITRFDQAIAAKGTRTDGALYWKAFAQFKLGRSNDANATLSELQKNHKDSKYLSDAKALESEIKRMAGQPARPENEDDEDLKLLALQGLINSDPERAIPLVQGVLSSAGSLKLKDRALYVLALSNSAQAHTILVNTAKSGTPDLQLKAISYLGINRGREGGKTSSAELMEIYNASQNDDVKRAIIRALGSAGDRAALVNVISGTTVSTLRNEAVNQLGSAQGQTELWTLYQRESSKELKMQILSTLGSQGAYDRIIDVAKTEKDADLRNRAIRSLGNMRAERSGAALVEIYGTLTDVTDKKAVISGLANQNNAEALISIARKETTWELKKTIVERLTNMPKNKAAQDYLMEIIK
jgi:HEAT repeat protein